GLAVRPRVLKSSARADQSFVPKRFSTGPGSRDFIQMGSSILGPRLHCLVGEKNGEAGAASPRLRTAAHSDAASVFTDNSMCDPQPQPGTLLTFCCEERLENLSSLLRRDARPVVGNEDTNTAGFRVP